MFNKSTLLIYLAAAACLAQTPFATAQQACTKIGFKPGQPDPNKCVDVGYDTEPVNPVTSAPPPPKPATSKPAQAAPAAPAPSVAAPTAAIILDASPQIAGIRKQAFSGIAQAAALAPLLPSGVGKTTAHIGAASYAGYAAVGFSFAHRPAQNFVFSGGLSVSSSGTSLVRLGAGFEF